MATKKYPRHIPVSYTHLDVYKRQAQGYAPYYLYRQKFTSGGFENVGWSLPGCENLYNIYIMEELCTILATVSYTHLVSW